jgi:hypothetical protein
MFILIKQFQKCYEIYIEENIHDTEAKTNESMSNEVCPDEIEPDENETCRVEGKPEENVPPIVEHIEQSLDMFTNKNCHYCGILRKINEEIILSMNNLKTQFMETVQKLISTSEQALQLNTLCEKLQGENDDLKQKLDDSRKQNKHLQEKLQIFLTQDQIERLYDGVTRGRAYMEDTITSSISLWFASGNVGYSYLLNHGLPIPSISTLHKRLEKVIFPSGQALHIMELLSRKVRTMSIKI